MRTTRAIFLVLVLASSITLSFASTQSDQVVVEFPKSQQENVGYSTISVNANDTLTEEWFNYTYTDSNWNEPAVEASEAFSITAMAPSKTGGMYFAFDFGHGTKHQDSVGSYKEFCQSGGNGVGYWYNNSTLNIGGYEIVPCVSTHTSSDPGEMHIVMAALGHRDSNGSWTQFEFFNHSISHNTWTDGVEAAAAEAFSITALTPSPWEGLYVAFDFGSGHTYESGSYQDSCSGQYGSWMNNETLTIGPYTMTPCSFNDDTSIQNDQGNDNATTIMAALGHLNSQGLWNDFEWFNHTHSSSSFDVGDGGAAESFSITSMSMSNNITYVAFDFGGNGHTGSYPQGCGSETSGGDYTDEYGSWVHNQTLEIGTHSIVPCKYIPGTSGNMTTLMSAIGMIDINGTWRAVEVIEQIHPNDIGGISIGSAAESFSITAMAPSERGAYIGINMGAAGELGSYGTTGGTAMCDGVGGTWHPDLNFTLSNITISPCSQVSTTWNSHLMAAFAHLGENGTWSYIEEIRGPGVDSAHSFSITALSSLPNDEVYVAFDFGSESGVNDGTDNRGSYGTSCANWDGEWNNGQKLYLGNWNVTPCESGWLYTPQIGMRYANHIMAGLVNYNPTQGWGQGVWFNMTDIGLNDPTHSVGSGHAAEAFSISAMYVSPTQGATLAVDFGNSPGDFSNNGLEGSYNSGCAGWKGGWENSDYMANHNSVLPNITPCQSTYNAVYMTITSVMAGIVNYPSLDFDLDGILNDNDSFPNDPSEWADLDGDGIGDNSDQDIDGDGIIDNIDGCTSQYLGWSSNSTTDHDSDGCRDYDQDFDDDNDGVLDLNDFCPLGITGWTSNLTTDHDSDGCQDLSEDSDDDNDGWSDINEINCNTDPVDNNSTPLDTDLDGVCNHLDGDDDGDGHPDGNDDFPLDPSEWVDTDGDGIGNNADFDDDDDGHPDGNDDFPLDPSEWVDTDGDGIGNNADFDDDDDGHPDGNDDFPLDPSEWVDTDGDGIGNNADLDDDNDGLQDQDDFCSDGETGWLSGAVTDWDNDGCQDVSEDLDDDSDGIEDSFDLCPKGYRNWFSIYETDYDGDGCHDMIEDLDDDNDGISDQDDQCPYSPLSVTVGQNGCEIDSDQDGVVDSQDAFPDDPTETTDTDGDGVGDNADAFPDDPTETTDTDGDGVGDNADAFPLDPTETTDTDGDGVGDNADAFPLDPTETTDTDGDGVGDNADAFPLDPTETTDTDGDGVGDNADAFPTDPTETTDTDGDGVGDNADAFPDDPTETTDTDGDGVGDNADAFPTTPPRPPTPTATAWATTPTPS